MNVIKQEFAIIVSDRVGHALNRQMIIDQGPVMFPIRFGSDPVGWFEVVRVEWKRGLGDCWAVTLRGVGELS